MKRGNGHPPRRLPLSTHPLPTLSPGTPCSQTIAWHVVAGTPLFPYLIGYRASTSLYGHGAAAVVRAGVVTPPGTPPIPPTRHHPPTPPPSFILLWDAGHEFAGGTPSAPAAKLSLFLHTADMAPGLEMWRFDHPVVGTVLTLRAERAGCGGGAAAVSRALSAAASGVLRGDTCAMTAAAPLALPPPGVLPAPVVAPLRAAVGEPITGPVTEAGTPGPSGDAPPLPHAGLGGEGGREEGKPLGERTPKTS